jgi:hypothetical protein
MVRRRGIIDGLIRLGRGIRDEPDRELDEQTQRGAREAAGEARDHRGVLWGLGLPSNRQSISST